MATKRWKFVIHNRFATYAIEAEWDGMLLSTDACGRHWQATQEWLNRAGIRRTACINLAAAERELCSLGISQGCLDAAVVR